MKHGGFRSRSRLDDALTIAIVESGVGVRAFDADRVTGPLGIRPSLAGEALEGRPGELPPGTLLGPVAVGAATVVGLVAGLVLR